MSDKPDSNSQQAALERAQTAKRTYEEALLARANVVGVGVGLIRRRGVLTGEIGIIVMVSRKVRRSELAPSDVVPTELEGVPVDVQEVGEIRAE